MEFQVFHSLDRPTEVFGIKGRYMLVMGLGVAVAIPVGVVVGALTLMIVGLGAAAVILVGVYLFIINFQAKVPERDMFKYLFRKRLPRAWSVPPKAVRNLWRGLN